MYHLQQKWFSISKPIVQFLLLFACALLAKAIGFAFDDQFYFYIGDSNEYLKTTTESYFPTARSWFLGYVIRWASCFQNGIGSLTSLIAWQSVATALGCSIAVWLVVLRSNRFLCLAVAIVCLFSLTPHQALYDRTILGEAFSTSLFSILLGLCLFYLRKRHLWILPIIGLFGVFCLSIRLAYMPITWGISILLPVVAFSIFKGTEEASVKKLSTALLISVLSTFLLHQSYQKLTSHMANLKPELISEKRKPAYQYDDGWFMLSARLGNLKPAYSNSDKMKSLLESSTIPLSRENRIPHLWHPEGIRARGFRAFGESKGNKIAKSTAMRSVIFSPIATSLDAGKNLVEFFSPNGKQKALKEDLNAFYSTEGSADLLPEYAERIEKHFQVQDLQSVVRDRTWTKTWYEKCSPTFSKLWIVSPFIILGLAIARKSKELLFLGLVGLAYLSLVLIMLIHPSYRLIMPLETLGLFSICSLLSRKSQ